MQFTWTTKWCPPHPWLKPSNSIHSATRLNVHVFFARCEGCQMSVFSVSVCDFVFLFVIPGQMSVFLADKKHHLFKFLLWWIWRFGASCVGSCELHELLARVSLVGSDKLLKLAELSMLLLWDDGVESESERSNWEGTCLTWRVSCS